MALLAPELGKPSAAMGTVLIPKKPVATQPPSDNRQYSIGVRSWSMEANVQGQITQKRDEGRADVSRETQEGF